MAAPISPPPAPQSVAQSSVHPPSALEWLAGQGVRLPSPAHVAIGVEVPLEAVAPGAELCPFTRLHGATTRVDAGAVIGASGPATLENSQIGADAVIGRLGPVTLRECTVGPGTVLGCGVAEQAVFLGKEASDPDFTTGYGFRVRSGSLYEEDASTAQHTDTKMTLLFPWVTLGSNLNFCDILVAGGTGPELGEFSEVGSGVIHFNFTPRGDKATGSRLGNVLDGVFLDQPRLFVGGNASLVGPLTGAFGAVTSAGGRYARTLRPGLNPSQPLPHPAGPREFPLEVYGSVRRVFTQQVLLIAELAALEAWYTHVRAHLASGDAARSALYAQGAEMVRLNLAERIRQLGALAQRMEVSVAHLEAAAQADARIAQQRALLEAWPRLEAELSDRARRQQPPPAEFLQALDAASAAGKGAYTATIQALSPAGREAGRAWLQDIVQRVATPQVLAAVPSISRD